MRDKPSRSTLPAATGAVPHADEPPTDNSASTLIEAPLPPGRRNPLDPHEFADGGGSGGADAFRRKPT